MNAVTVELRLAEDIYLALQSSGMHREEIRAHAQRDLGVQLYTEGRLSFGKAAQLVGLPKQGFWALLNERGLPVFNYTEDDYEADLGIVRGILAKEDGKQ